MSWSGFASTPADQILGSPNVGGLWYGPSNSLFGNFNTSFDPSTNSSGTYSYIVQGTTSY